MELWDLHYKKDLNLLEWGHKNDNRIGEERLKKPWFCEEPWEKKSLGRLYRDLSVPNSVYKKAVEGHFYKRM